MATSPTTTRKTSRDGTGRNGAGPIGNDGLTGYFVAAYALSWAFWIPAVLMDSGRLDLPVPSFALALLGGLGPMLAAILLSARESGLAGVRALFGQLARWRVHPRWYAAALIGVPAIGLVAAGVHAALGGALATETLPAVLLVLPVQFLFVALLGGGLDEETGWRGFALPRLQERYGPVVANLVLGALWTCWHLPLFFMGDGGLFADSSFGLYLVRTMGVSFVFAWLYNSTGGSLLLAVLAHAAHNVTTSAAENLVPDPSLGTLSPLQYGTVEALAWVLVVGAILVATRGTLNAHRVPAIRSRPGGEGTGPEPATV